MLNIFFASLTSSVILFGFGIIFNYLFLNDEDNHQSNIYETGIFGIIFLSFFALFLNFFLPINKLVGSIISIVSTMSFFYFIYLYKKKLDLIFIILIASFVSFTLITLSNINRPDAGLYHLPFVSLLHESKIIIGSVNIHHRFGHISIIQYLSAIHNNYIFKTEFINVPLASIFSFYIIFIFKKFFDNLRKNDFGKIFINFLIIIFSFYAFNRYGNYGNDAPVHIFFFILIIFFLEINNLKEIQLNEFYKIVILSLFLITLKPFMVIVLLLPLILFYLNEKKLFWIKKKQFFICLFLISIWFLKNILISGCLIYPLNKSCIKSLIYFDEKNTLTRSYEGEAWSKGVPDSKGKFSSHKEYIKKFNWLPTWKENHLKKIVEKILPYLILLFLILIIVILRKIYFRENSNKSSIDEKDYILLFFSFYCCAIWFLKFPLYRFGMSFIFIFITLLFIFLLKKMENFNNFKFYNFIFTTLIIVGVLGFLGKNFYRIVNKFDKKYNNYPWPKIYTLSDTKENILPNYKKIVDEKNQTLFYYSNGVECMYSKAPCSNYSNPKLKLITKYGYKIYYKD